MRDGSLAPESLIRMMLQGVPSDGTRESMAKAVKHRQPALKAGPPNPYTYQLSPQIISGR